MAPKRQRARNDKNSVFLTNKSAEVFLSSTTLNIAHARVFFKNQAAARLTSYASISSATGTVGSSDKTAVGNSWK